MLPVSRLAFRRSGSPPVPIGWTRACADPSRRRRSISVPYPFLSDEWLEEARKIRAEYEGTSVPFPHVVRMNLVVTTVPFGDHDIDAHMDTSSGNLILEVGHLEAPDL